MNRQLLPTLRLSLEMADVLARIEQAGIKINLDTLAEIKAEYEQELDQTQRRLDEIVYSVMGDTPVNLNSADDRTILFYSRHVKNKTNWGRLFNIGQEMRGATRKNKQRVRMSKSAFAKAVRDNTVIKRKTRGSQCTNCFGKGRYTPNKKDGSVGKEVAGLKIVPRGVMDVAAAGFKTDKGTLEGMLSTLSGVAHEFVTLYIRYSALRTYLNTFVEGMENNVDANDFIHPEFMQCVTATGRLSSRNPNFQNMPRGSTFRIRKVVESRFEGGSIIEGDYSQLEFRVAGFLAQDSQAYKDVEDGADVHSYTASIIGCDRQTAKGHTFKPLYGGTTGTPEQQKYYRAFKEKYSDITDWHDKLQRDAVTKKHIVLPSGRTYYFPDTKWTRYGTATNRTAICNYPVQGFATADVLPCCLVELSKQLEGLNSLVCNTVHDSIVVDCYPSEEEQVINILKNSMLGVAKELKLRYNLNYDMPIGIEIKKGENWLDTDVVYPI